MTDYAKAAARADQSLRRKGGVFTLRQVVKGSYDPEEGASGPATELNFDGTGVKVAYDAEELAGTTIQAGDEKLLLSPLQRDGTPMPTPTSADLILFGARKFEIVHVAKTEPVAVAVLFTLQLRAF